MTELSNVKDNKVKCGICNEWKEKESFVLFKDASFNQKSIDSKLGFACCLGCAEKFKVLCNHTGEKEVKIITIKDCEHIGSHGREEWGWAIKKEQTICKDCGEIISEKEISKERYYDDWR